MRRRYAARTRQSPSRLTPRRLGVGQVLITRAKGSRTRHDMADEYGSRGPARVSRKSSTRRQRTRRSEMRAPSRREPVEVAAPMRSTPVEFDGPASCEQLPLDSRFLTDSRASRGIRRGSARAAIRISCRTTGPRVANPLPVAGNRDRAHHREGRTPTP